MADGIKIRQLNQTTLIDNSDVFVIDKDDPIADSSLTYYITYSAIKGALFSEDITLEGNVTIENGLTVNGSSEFNGSVNINNRLTVDGTVETNTLIVNTNTNLTLGQLSDVAVDSVQPNYFLMYNGSSWIPQQVEQGSGGQSGEYIMFEGGSTAVTFKVTVGPKTQSNQFFGVGSIECFYIDGVEAPNLLLPANRKFIFDQSDASNTNKPFRFFEDQSESVISSPSTKPGLTVEGLPGFTSGKTIVEFTSTFDASEIIEEQTPRRLYYRCFNSSSNNKYMGATIVNVANALDVKIGEIDMGEIGGGEFPGLPLSARNKSLPEVLLDLYTRIGTIEGTVLELE